MKHLHPIFAKLLNRVTHLGHSGPLSLAAARLQHLMRNHLATQPGSSTVEDVPAADPAFTSHADEHGRHYKVFVPSSLQGQQRPMVVMLHGCTQSPDDFAAGTRMNEIALEQGFVVLYPAQPERSNASKCWNWFNPSDQKRDHGEPAALARITRQVMAEHSIDAQRVYVAGLSAGGAMAAIMGREYPDLFAATGVHSGLPQGAAHDLGSALAAMKGALAQRMAKAKAAPTIVFHGDEDRTVHPSNGHSVIADALPAGTHTQSSVLEGSHAGRRYTRSVYANERGIPCAEHWVVHGAGHAWSGGSHLGSYADALGPDASREMLRFFWQHPAL